MSFVYYFMWEIFISFSFKFSYTNVITFSLFSPVIQNPSFLSPFNIETDKEKKRERKINKKEIRYFLFFFTLQIKKKQKRTFTKSAMEGEKKKKQQKSVRGAT